MLYHLSIYLVALLPFCLARTRQENHDSHFVWCFRVFFSDGFSYFVAAAFSTPAFSTTAICSRIFHSCIFHSRIFSAPLRHWFACGIDWLKRHFVVSPYSATQWSEAARAWAVSLVLQVDADWTIMTMQLIRYSDLSNVQLLWCTELCYWRNGRWTLLYVSAMLFFKI